MQHARIGAPRLAIALALAVLALASLAPGVIQAQAVVARTHNPTWSKDLDGWVQRGSVAFGNVDGDGDLEIFVGTNAGKVYGYNPDGSALPGWGGVNVVGSVASAPVIGDITGDGAPEVVITAGGLVTNGNNTGSIWAFSAGGQQLWRKVTTTTSSTGLPGGVFASPVLVDLDGNGVLDVLTGSYDQNVYALKGDGSPVFPSTPLTAKNIDRNGALIWLGDGTWATPAVGDVDGDGVVDIVVTSATNIDARFSYIYPGWNDQATVDACSKTKQDATKPLDRSQKRACGLVAVFSNTGQLKPGWPKFIAGHTYDASPALANLDGDPQLEIITGNGWDPTYGDLNQPFFITIWNHDGSISNRTPNIGAPTVQSGPVIGDITGDSRPEIVIGTNAVVSTPTVSRIYAYDSGLNLLPGFPIESRDAQFNRLSSPTNITLADISSDGKADIIFGSNWDVRAVNGGGQYLNSNLVIHGTGPFTGQPAVANIDGDPNLELVYAAGRGTSPGIIRKFDLEVAAPPRALPWAQFHGDPFHTGLYALPDLIVAPSVGAITAGADQRVTLPIGDTAGGTLTWSASASAAWIKLGATSGTAGKDGLPVTLDAGAAPFAGGVATGTITVTAEGVSKEIAVRLVQVDEIRGRVFIPVIRH